MDHNFTTEFENLILACYINHPEEFLKYGNIVKSEYFSSTRKVLMESIKEFNNKFSKFPSWISLGQYACDFGKRYNMDEKEIQAYIKDLKEIDTLDCEYIIERLISFCKERETLILIRKAAGMIQEGTVPELGFAGLFEDVLKIGQNVDDLGLLFHADVDDVVKKITDVEAGVHTGYPQYDSIWRNGWGKGWLIVPLAPPKRYKSTFCTNLALNMAGPAVGADVLYYTLEISSELCMQRAMFNLTKLTEVDLYRDVDQFKRDVKQSMNQYIHGNLLFKHFPIGTATIADIKAHATMVKRQLGINPKAIIIDYADTVKFSNSSDQEYVKQSSIYKEAIALGYAMGCCVIMPDRCTKEAIDSRVPSMKHFQGAFAKGGLVDISIGLCATDTEYSQNILRTFVFINRHGKAFQHFRGIVDPETYTIDIGAEIPYEAEDEENSGKIKYKKRKSAIPEELLE